jgi:hydrophobe/amphiphile efflux-1 (HAE1) family protein
MNMSTWSIKNPVPPILLFIVLCIIGWFSFERLSVTRFPNIDVPLVNVSVSQSGATAKEMSNQVTKKLEDALFSLNGLKHISSEVSNGFSNTMLEFEIGFDSTEALNDVKDEVAKVESSLPDAAAKPIIQKIDVTGEPILTYAIADATQTTEELSYFIDNVITRELQLLPGVAKVNRIGGADKEVVVDLSLAKLSALNITVAEVSRQLRTTNQDIGAGRGTIDGQEFTLRTLGAADSLATLQATPILLSNGSYARLDELGTVAFGTNEPRSYATNQGKEVVSFNVQRSSGASDLVAGEKVKKRLAELTEQYPNINLTLIVDATIYTEGNYHSAMETLYEGAILAVLVILLFLRDWRATLITAVALPLSIIPTFFVMDILGFSLNTISLLGITLVTGILVDDAIVEIENISRHMDMGKTAYDASVEAANEIGVAVIAISFTIVAVFAPVSFMSGIAGQYFQQFGLTVAIAVLFSLLVARIITPMMSAYLLKTKSSVKEQKDGWIMSVYMRILKWTLHHRAATLVLGLLIFMGSIYSATLLPTEFVPATDEGRVALKVELPPGSSLKETKEITQIITQKANEIPEIKNVYVYGGDGSLDIAKLDIDFGKKQDRERKQPEIVEALQQILADIPDAKLTILKNDGQRDISLSIVADNAEGIDQAVAQLIPAMSALPSLDNVSSSSAVASPEVRINLIPEKAAKLGVTVEDIASLLTVSTLGDDDTVLAQFNYGERQLPIRVRVQKSVREDLSQLMALRVKNSSGQSIPLSAVAEIVYGIGPSTISRYDRNYRTLIEADLDNGALLGPTLEQIYALDEVNNLPKGVALSTSGDAENMAEVFTQFALAMAAGILLVYMVLVLLFGSFITPITILLSLPLSIGGAILGLYLTNSAIGLSVVIGFLMLMGIVTKNAIMIVEFALEAINAGVPKAEAVLDAGHKRARPIVMTTIAMVAGMMPSALAFGTGGEFRAPMAIAVIGGLLVSTLLSLIFVPSLFSVFEGFKNKCKSLIIRLVSDNQSVDRKQSTMPLADINKAEKV